MPVYLCNAPEESLDADKRRRIAGEITRIHCELTGAPPTFAHVIFGDADGVSVFGTIRAGRDDALKAEMRRQMSEAVAKTIGVDASEVAVHTHDIPASWVMEGGALLPEPGEEEAWLAEHGSD